MSHKESSAVSRRQRELEAIDQREHEIKQRLYEIQEQQEKLNLEYRQLYAELMGIPNKHSLAQRALMEAQLKLNKGGQPQKE